MDDTPDQAFPEEVTVTSTETYGSLDESLPLDVPKEHTSTREVVSSGSKRCGETKGTPIL